MKRSELDIHEKLLALLFFVGIVAITAMTIAGVVNGLCRYQSNYGTNGGQYICIWSK